MESTLEPAVDFGRLEHVFVMLRRGPTMELLYETDTPAVPESPQRTTKAVQDREPVQEAGGPAS